MQINIKSNRNFMVKLLLPFVVILVLCVVSVAITLMVENDKELVPVLIYFCVFTAVMIAALLIAKFYKGRRYEFTESEIVCYNRDELLNRINISDIENIKFFKYKFKYIIPMYIMEVESGGCWSLHVRMKDGSKKVLRFFSVKDALLLKEKLFGDLLTII